MIIKKPYSFRKRLLVILLISSLIPLFLIGYTSYVTIFSLLNNNIEDGIQNNLKQIRISVTYAFDNLESSSLQLSVDDMRIANKINEYLTSDKVIDKYVLQQEIVDSIAVLNTVRSDLGTIFFYHSGLKEIIFENQGVDSNFDLNALPAIAEGVNYKLFGPHKSAKFRSNQSVFSVLRKVYVLDDIDLYVYIETNFQQFEDLFNSQEYDLNVKHILLNDKGQILYSQIGNEFPVGENIDISGLNISEKTELNNKDYYLFTEKGKQGWYVIAAINKNDYNYVIRKWIGSSLIFAILTVMSSALLAYSIWRMVYRPLRRLNTEIGLMAQNKFDSNIKRTGINEFDNVLGQFQFMRDKILELFRQIEEKERKKRMVEIQILLHQINPHFLHNTLNTIQWLARMNGQDEIDRLAALFAKVLHYNLGKEGGIVRLSEEIDALRDYMELQRFRLDQQINFQVNIDESLMDIKIPRFIMQPIVENAIRHGLKCEDGTIEIEAFIDNDDLIIAVKDDGSGISEDDIEKLMTDIPDEFRKGGMGIGLKYVKNILDIYYDNRAMLEVSSNGNTGTVFKIHIPVNQ